MLLQVNNLHTYYGNIKALRGVTFNVNEGEILSFIGANGAGKSTLMNTLSGTLKPKMGEILFNGENITKMTPQQRVSKGIILCPEGRQIFPKFTVEENLKMGAYTVKDRGEIEEKLSGKTVRPMCEKVEVVAPESLRKKLVDAIEEMAKKYGKENQH